MKNIESIVIFGGGHGPKNVALGLVPEREVSIICDVSDDGGSTGRLRQISKRTLPWGDIRNSLVDLARNRRLAKVFNYRIDEHKRFENVSKYSISGHNIGNIILFILNILFGAKTALSIARLLLKPRANIIPVSYEPMTLYAQFTDDQTGVGQYCISHTEHAPIAKVWLMGNYSLPRVNPEAIKAIQNANCIIFGPGLLFGSVIAAAGHPDIQREIVRSKAKKIFMVNCINHIPETNGYKVKDYARHLCQHIPGLVLDEIRNNKHDSFGVSTHQFVITDTDHIDGIPIITQPFADDNMVYHSPERVRTAFSSPQL